MPRILDTLRSGDWLNAGRIRLWALAVLVAAAGGLGWLVATSNGLNDYQGRPLGTDFSNVYAAGTYVIEGRPAAPFDPRLQHAREQEIFGAATPFYGWHYPPLFLFVAAALALLPYQLALIVWQGVTLLLYLLSIRAIASLFIPPPPGEGGAPKARVRASSTRYGATGGDFAKNSDSPPDRRFAAATLPASRGGIWLLLALAFPAVFVNLGHGHNGFLTAALFGLALVQFDRRPVAAGILFGLIANKPQFGLLIPLVLAATGRWRSFTAAAATVAGLLAITTLWFGTDAWRAFFTFADYTRAIVLETGETGWHKIQSVFSWARMWGAGVPLAYAVQGAATLAIAAALVWLWRTGAAFALKAAALCLATVIATPYSLDYDLMLLAPAIAFLALDGLARGFAPYEKTALAALWAVPLVARGIAQATLIPLGVIAILSVFALVLHRARADLGAPQGTPLPAR